MQSTHTLFYDLIFFKGCIVFNCIDFTIPYYCKFEVCFSFLLLLDSFLRLYSSKKVIKPKGITVTYLSNLLLEFIHLEEKQITLETYSMP